MNLQPLKRTLNGSYYWESFAESKFVVTAFISQIVRVERCEIKTLQVALCKVLKYRHLEFINEHEILPKNN